MEHGETKGREPVVESSLLAVVAKMTPWERIVHNDRMIRTIGLLRGPRATVEVDGDG